MSTPSSIFTGLRVALGGWILVCAAVSAVPARAADAPDFGFNPPSVDDVFITATDGTQGGNALLQAVYTKGQNLPDAIPFNVNDKPVTLRRDAQNPQSFSAAITFDFDAFVNEQSQRQAVAARGATVPVFVGREQVDTQPLAFIDPNALRTAIARRVPIHILPGIVLASPTAIAANSLMVTALPVVEDPTRTFDACTGAGNPSGAWTFNRLITNIANPAVTGVDPADFVENWLKTWNTPTTINGFPVPARLAGATPVMNTQVLNVWPRLASGKLDLTRSPLRLLAIANRVDLRTNSGYSSGSAGEGRFVFGVVRPGSGGACTPLRFTVILEYGIPRSGCASVRDWGTQWGALDSFVLGSPSYNAALQAITDQFTAANAAPAKPNRSAINQIRTNEILVNPWELREFNVNAVSHQLAIVSPKQTPHTSFHGSGTLATYINTNQPLILLDKHLVPASMMGGSVPNPFPQVTWDAAGIANNDARHHFALNTCDACHGLEAGTTSFLHVEPRNPGVASVLSRFLVGTGTVTSPSTFTMPDPVDGVTPRTYGDLVRRQADLVALQSSVCSSTAPLSAMTFMPIGETD